MKMWKIQKIEKLAAKDLRGFAFEVVFHGLVYVSLINRDVDFSLCFFEVVFFFQDFVFFVFNLDYIVGLCFLDVVFF